MDFRSLVLGTDDFDRPRARRIFRTSVDRDHRLAPFAQAARHVARGGLVVHDDAQARARGQLLEAQLGAHEGERANLATQIERVTR